MISLYIHAVNVSVVYDDMCILNVKFTTLSL